MLFERVRAVSFIVRRLIYGSRPGGQRYTKISANEMTVQDDWKFLERLCIRLDNSKLRQVINKVGYGRCRLESVQGRSISDVRF